MAASRYEYKREITDDCNAFFERTDILVYTELEWLDFELDDFTGSFWPRQLPLLLELCKNNREYHIVSMTHPGLYENRYVPGAKLYMIAQGDKNPQLVLSENLNGNMELDHENILEKALAILNNVDRGHK